MADIKERKRDKDSIKEKRTSVPKEPLKQETIHSIQWARQQVQEAAEPDPQENERAGVGMSQLRVPQIRQHSRPKTKQAAHDTPTATEKSTRESNIMSTRTRGESAPNRIQESYTHAQEQGRKLAIRQETEKTVRIKERVENAPSFDSVLKQEAEPFTLSDPVRERPASPSVSSTVKLQSAPAEHHEALPKTVKSADKYKHVGIKGNPHTVPRRMVRLLCELVRRPMRVY